MTKPSHTDRALSRASRSATATRRWGMLSPVPVRSPAADGRRWTGETAVSNHDPAWPVVDQPGWVAQVAEAAADPQRGVPRICDLCVDVLGVTGVSVSVTSVEGVQTTVHATDGHAVLVEELQFTLGEGPCVDAFTSGVPVLISDIRDPVDLVVARWSTFLAQADAIGVRALFAFPLRIGAIRIGAMDLYADRPGPLDKPVLAACWVAADAVTGHLLERELPASEAGGEDRLWAPMSGLQVHQATGMVQVQLDVSTREALLRLRAHAFAEGRRLRDVSADVVARRLRFRQEDDHE